ncbi:MAG TPA: Hsp20/alpha crystallin family protein [Chthoniobacterales bacterium]|nr:Hsp20/alpha crystallin family protein [Chthoniobacterales bacterium]
MNIPSLPSKEQAMAPYEDNRPAFVTPLVDIETTDDGYIIQAEMPGVEKGGVEITVDHGELTILGRRKPTELTAELIYREIQPHDFRRVYELDPSIDTTKLGAKIDDGILTVTLPKAETVKPRKISVQ